MNILLILPAAPQWRITKKKGRTPRLKMGRFSILSLTTIAALTPEKHNLTICDENVAAIDLDSKPDVVGISFMTGLAPRAYELSVHFRSKGIITVAGGYHPTLCTDEVAQHFDITVAGSAEDSWQRVLEDIEANRFKSIYKAKPDTDLSSVPVPNRDLLKKTRKRYATTYAVQTGKGCNNKCKFCAVTAFFNHTHRRRPLKNVLSEIRTLPRYFMFVDDNIIADADYAKKLFEAMIPLKKRWISQCSMRIADNPELLDLAYRAGCRGLFIGIESLSSKNLADMGKTWNDNDNYYNHLKTIQDKRIMVQVGVIVGLDDDDITVFKRTLDFLQKAHINAVQVAILTPHPGTPLFEELNNAGRIIDRNWYHYDFRHSVFQPKQMTAQKLQDGADWLYSNFYRLDRVIMRSIRSFFKFGLLATFLCFRLNMNYRYTNRIEKTFERTL